jgi:hypothetical protein
VSSGVKALAFDPSGRSIVVGEQEARLHTWRLDGVPERLAHLDLTTLGPEDASIDPADITQFSSVAFSDRGITALSGRRLFWRDPAKIGGEPDEDRAIAGGRALSRDGSRILSSSREITLTTDDGRELLRLPGLAGSWRGSRVDLSPDGRTVLTVEVDNATKIALLNTARIMAESRPPTVENALSWFPRALVWGVRHARLDRKCPYKLSELAAEAAAHHAALAGVQGDNPEAALRAEQEAQRGDVETALADREIETPA